MTRSSASATRLTGWAWLASLAACLSLAPLVSGSGFLVAGAVAGALVAGVGAAGRRVHAPLTLIVVLQLVVLLLWATLTYASAEAWAGLLPTRDSLAALADLVGAALTTAEEYAPPAPELEGVEASLAAVVAGVVLVVDLVAVSWRRPALVGLVFLGVYMAPVSLLAGEVPVLAFLPGALAYVFLLGVEQRDRVTHWGRQIGVTSSLLSARDRERVTVASLVQSGRRVGLGAVALAVVVPLLIPTLPRTFLADGPLTGGQDGSGPGDGTVDIENPMLDLRRNLGERTDSVLVTMRTNGVTPTYLRIASLDDFTGSSWQPGPRPDSDAVGVNEVPQPPGLTTSVERIRLTSIVTLSDSFRTTWLPTFYPATDLAVAGAWGMDVSEFDISAREEGLNGAGLTYRVSAAPLLPSAAELADAPDPIEDMSRYLELPGETPPSIGQLAEEVTQGEDTAFGRAEALQDWFRSDGGFVYSLAPGPGDGLETIERFLQTERVGYCEQFASSMALMARTLGIPARVAVGFLRPQQADDGTWTFRGVDMHAWPELFFEGIGWVRFEPTPGVRTGAAPSFEEVTDSGSFGDSSVPTQATPGGPDDTPSTPRQDATASGGAGDDGGAGRGLLLAGLGLVTALALAVAPRAARAARREARWRRVRAGRLPAAEAAWAELTDTAVDLGIRVDPAATLRTSGRRLRSQVDGDEHAVGALNRLVVDVERSRFAPVAGRAARTADIAGRDVAAVNRRLWGRRTAQQRWRARWLPASLLPRSTGRGDRTWWRGRVPGSGLLLRTEDQPR